MKLPLRLIVLTSTLALLSAPLFAQAPRGRLLVTVVDTTNAVIPDTRVTVTALDDAAGAAAIAPVQTSPDGVAIVDRLVPGRYSILAEFSGFEPGKLEDVRVRPGDNKHVVILKIQGLQESVTVAREGQEAASDRASATFGLSLSTDQIDALSDDPAELERQLNELAGPNAILRIDSFEGLQLPPKAQIKSVHVTRDQFAAESPNAGDTFIDIITQPGVGPIRGGFNSSFRDGSTSARNPFTPEKGPEQMQRYGFNVGGALVPGKSSFSLSLNGSTQYTAPNIYVATPSGGTHAEALNLKTPVDQFNMSALVDYALTRDQTLRLGFYRNVFNQENLGVGAYDLPGRAYTARNAGSYIRVQEAGPIGRRVFINTRFLFGAFENSTASAIEAPTVRVTDAFVSGGAQQRGGRHQRAFDLATDVDYIRGIHSWRTGGVITGFSSRSDASTNYLGTYTFPSPAAFDAGEPSLYTRFVGDPLVSYFNAQGGVYFQDDIRVRKGLTLSPGVRYTLQTHVDDYGAVEPRFGVTWAPFKSGTTTLRASAGIFHGWLGLDTYEQTLRVNGTNQRELVIVNPPYPNPGADGVVPPTSKYILGDYQLQKTIRYSAGIDQAFTPRFRVNVLYNYMDLVQLPRGLNLNAPVDGVRPDPAFANVIEAVTDAELIRHELYVNVNLNLAPPAAASSRARFNWRKLALVGGYQFISAQRNADGPFDVPPSGTLDTEWGPGPADNPYRFNVSLNSTQVRDLSANLSWFATDGSPYTLATGVDDNQDGIINDRPAGVGLRSLRTTTQASMSARLTYTFVLGGAPKGAPAQPRYRLGVFASVNNLTNRVNFGGFSGVMTSPFFMQPTLASNPRKFDFGMNLSF